MFVLFLIRVYHLCFVLKTKDFKYKRKNSKDFCFDDFSFNEKHSDVLVRVFGRDFLLRTSLMSLIDWMNLF